MPKFHKNRPGETERVGASSLSASESPDAARRAVTSVLRRQGHLLMSIFHVAMEELIKHELQTAAEELSDAIKPCIDALLHIDLSATEVDRGE